MQDADPKNYLASCAIIDFDDPSVTRLAKELAHTNALATAERCFTYVRDHIKHSSDYQLNPVTCSASAVLEHATGYCYAKSHLLCALLRANRIPAGLCYQRLSTDSHGPPFCLHGLNAVYLPKHGWYRMDARGNRENINAQFRPPVEQLAFATKLPGEIDLPEIYATPLPEVASMLNEFRTRDEVLNNLPDTADDSIIPAGEA